MTQRPIPAVIGAASPDPGTQTLSFAFDGTQAEVRKAIQRVEAWLATARMLEVSDSRLLIALAEALNNVVEHALGPDHGRIGISLVLTAAGVEVEISDDGRPMPGGVLPPSRPRDLNVVRPHLPEGGFGWDIIREIAVGISYQRVAGKNRLRFRVTATRRSDHG